MLPVSSLIQGIQRMKVILIGTLALGAFFTITAPAQSITPEIQNKINEQLKVLQEWGNDPFFVSAAKNHNSSPASEVKAMTNEKWATLSLLDPFVRSFTKNTLGTHLKELRNSVVSEIFVSGADGRKIAFLAKPTYWSHSGKPKQDIPMGGKTWQGPLELDSSTGVEQVQLAFPILDDKVPIGVIVVGINIHKL